MVDSINKLYSEIIYKRSYARWLENKKRRETWDETVDRYKNFFLKYVMAFDDEYLYKFYNAIEMIRKKEIMPSMRALWAAGLALRQENIAGFNCAYTPIDRPKSFAEVLYILMCGTGVGYSVERQYINKLPEVPANSSNFSKVITFEDSKLGWAEGYNEVIETLYAGNKVVCDYSKIRPKGSRLKTFGGRSSGPEPLKQLVDFTIKTFEGARGRKLNSLEIYDILGMIANAVIVGGVRRSATITLSNLSDQRMRDAKTGQFWIDRPQRAYSNNSVAYTEKPDLSIFLEEWIALMKSGSGERGIVNREALQKGSSLIGRHKNIEYGVNPCGEVILRPRQFCNLTEVVVRPMDTIDTLKKKVEAATILGILQSMLSDFKFLDPEWKENTEDERLLGVSLTGLADNPILSTTNRVAQDWLDQLRRYSINVADQWAVLLKINMPAAITTVKPSGTVSQLVDAASGLHPRYSPYYIRRVRMDSVDPLAKYLLEAGVPCSPEVGQTWDNYSTLVFEFPLKSPANSLFRNQVTAIEQLEYWKMLKTNWCEHNPSCTIYVKDHEWLEVADWVYKNWDIIGGISFLPYDSGVYQLAPYEEITKEQYEKLVKEFPKDINLELITEETDQTEGSREYACTGDKCELI